MVVRIARILSACGVLILLTGGRPTVCEGWSLLSPFSSDAKTDAKAKKPGTTAVNRVKKEPSTLDKVGAGTKKFFNKTGETLGLKKPEPKKFGYANPQAPRVQPARKPEQKSWLGSLSPFKSEEPPRPRNVSEWMSNKRLDP
jgi:hypothetical protein